MGLLLHPPKSDDRYAQLTRGAFIINDFLRNPHFSWFLQKNTFNLSMTLDFCLGNQIQESLVFLFKLFSNG